jgi:hypothetical protein
MKVGLQLVCQRHDGYPDAEMFTETTLAIEAERPGLRRNHG